jgi:cytochrome c-type biogenesis protein CcmH
MIWVFMFLLALLTVAPLGLYAWRGARLRSRQYASIALHRAQLRELDQELADGRIVVEEHAAAKLEVQRRLLSDAALTESVGKPAGTSSIVLTAVLVPAVALLLYLRLGQPQFPPKDAVTGAPQPTAAGATEDPAKAARDEELIGQLKARLEVMDQHADRTVQGYQILGQAELSRGHLAEAGDAWKHVLAEKFDPTLAAETAEVLTEAAGDKITPEALALFKRALAEAPADAPWRPMAEKRVAEAGS